MRSGDLWVLANINATGYYRVNYDLGNWERLLAQLKSEHQVHSQDFTISWMQLYRIIKLCVSICCVGDTSDKQSPACG